MILDETQTLLRQCAAGDITWTSLCGRGIDNYRDVLAGPGAKGLRLPVAPLDGPNVEAGCAAGLFCGRRYPKPTRDDPPLGLLVTDASPLITLAAADAGDPEEDRRHPKNTHPPQNQPRGDSSKCRPACGSRQPR